MKKGENLNLDISLDLYKIYCAVVRTGNMSAAAKELYISQPAVSMSVRQLEDRMGSPLLIRTTKGVRTTPEGSMLYEYLEQALSLIKTAEKKYFEMVNLEDGEIRIGASDTVIANYLMPYLEKFNNIYPNINIKVTNKTTYESLKLLKNGSVDLCFVNLPIENSNEFDIIECIEIHDCLVGGSKYRELAETGIKLSEINKYPLLLLEDLSNTRRYIDKFALENSIELHPIIELGSSDILLDFVKINLGLTFTIKEFTKAIDNENIFEIPLTPPVPPRSVGLVKLKGVALSNSAKGFCDIMDIKV
ncbi:MAG: LysR family transcriptional regulator [Tyzzerella sp.]|uniref:LysR family transcriptional regulator n=1 Tax=Candidatus Fimicola merdigallinarum TaxID=2840819 RepID=A0A9D9DZB2_9FIRM|nr:LysR family transcriptional regulator [Candidatus Fimicola merdigallinarum]